MRRRDVPKALLASAAAASAVASESAAAQSCTAPCYPQTSKELAAGVTPTNYACVPGDVRRYGAVGDGNAPDTDAFDDARAATGGRYFISPGTYAIAATPNVWEDSFFASDNAKLVIDSEEFDVSGAFWSGWRVKGNTERYLTIQHARTEKDLLILSDGELAGDSHRVFLPWDIRRDSHALLMSPHSNGGVTDLLWRRSEQNADNLGNRFAVNFEESLDRWSVSFATSASGAPQFDLAMAVVAGPSAKITFPALAAQFNQGIEIKQRAAGGYRMSVVPAATKVQFKDADTGNVSLTIRDQCIGFYGSDGTSRQTVTGSKGGNAALASLITKLANLGLITDSTT